MWASLSLTMMTRNGYSICRSCRMALFERVSLLHKLILIAIGHHLDIDIRVRVLQKDEDMGVI